MTMGLCVCGYVETHSYLDTHPSEDELEAELDTRTVAKESAVSRCGVP